MHIDFSQKGFSLIEMAVVLVIVGLLLGGLLVPLSTQMESDRRKETTATLESIRDALLGYAVINGRLPCPDISTPRDGLADACTSGANQITVRGLPYATLGVSATDAWGNPWVYAVNGAYTQPLGLPPPAITNNGAGDIEVRDSANCAGNQLGEMLPALVVSNASATNTGTLEPENRDGDRCFVNAGYSLVPNGFDDLIIWIPTGVLYNRLVAAGKVP